ncbi:hypothetical protein Rsub_10142 [Raphidocelis subcapitata]|uniref:Threonine aspartase n=1 Tax=Raphidocelis subcapitata TaxID=307507 RepID=A0A2V0PCG6_9CHLO|nr:hypothetical protein Rsub_10142 [Raphidocelis subcapitata]|eukprot:GBF97541.1 hypothetical protein Rsub_10142 [Raphidocelis subcapitata]
MAHAPPPRPPPPCLVAVHVGAGWHAPAKEASYTALMRAALDAARAALAGGGAALDAVVAALRVLEDSPLTNAGYGSNLNAAGRVEADACVAAGDGAAGAVGAAPGLRHPAAAAARMAEESRVPLPLGLVRPMLLAGDAARRWALSRGLEAAADADSAQEWQISPAARSSWERYSKMLEAAGGGGGGGGGGSAAAAAVAEDREQQQKQKEEQQPEQQQQQQQQPGEGPEPPDGPPAPAKRPRLAPPPASAAASAAPPRAERLADVSDTVGALVVCADGATAAGVSSGGLAMKTEGRVGEAAILGCGCWADDPGPGGGGPPGTAVSISGLGEAIMRAGLARAASEGLLRGEDACPSALLAALVESQMVSGRSEAIECGVLACRVARSGSGGGADGGGGGGGGRCAGGGPADGGGGGACRVRVELAAASSAPTFGVAWWAASMRDAEVAFLRLPGAEAGGRVAALEYACAWGAGDPAAPGPCDGEG